MAVELTRQELRRMEQHGAEAYPNECCGVLLGKEQDGRKVITDILPLKNARADARQSSSDLLPEGFRDGSSRNRFLIFPEDLLQSEREARKRGVDIMGFYHSHPDHPARPSEYDRKAAWPWYTYLILAVENGSPREITGWLLTEDRLQFLPEEVAIKGSEE
jgi:proteasome lid subunit RPN8/RPN11